MWPTNWTMCRHDGCIGVVYGESEKCVVHGSADFRQKAFDELGQGQPCEWTRGLVINHDFMEEMLAAARSQDGLSAFPFMDFSGATFVDDAEFMHCRFSQNVHFSGAEFHGQANFALAAFVGQCGFKRAEFHGRAFFKSARLETGGLFQEAGFHDAANFLVAEGGDSKFDRAQFDRAALFQRKWDGLSLKGCSFADQTSFLVSASRIDLSEATFNIGGDLGYLVAAHDLNLSRVVFREQFVLRMAARRILMDADTEAPSRIEFIGDLDLEDASFGGSTLLTAVSAGDLRSMTGERVETRPARIASLRHTDVSQLRLGSVDLTALFDGWSSWTGSDDGRANR
jgi:uncharacterized protein YjbI with pentapeptide repeats